MNKKIILLIIIAAGLVGLLLHNSPSHNEKISTLIPQPTLSASETKIPEPEFSKNNNSLIYEYHLQLGAFKTPYFAENLSHKVTQRGYTVHQRMEIVNNQKFMVVEVGPFTKYLQAKKHKKFLEKDNPSLGKILIKKRIKN